MINLKLREDALIAKCLGRRICSECGGNYNVACIDIKADDDKTRMYMPPLLPPSHCENKLITRSDDTEDVVKERLRIYHETVLLYFIFSLLFLISHDVEWLIKTPTIILFIAINCVLFM